MKDKSLKATTCWQGCMYNTRVCFACPIYFSRDQSSSGLIIFHYLKLEKEPTWVSRISTWDSTPVIFEDQVSSRVSQIVRDYQLSLGQYCNKVYKRGCIFSNFCKERLLSVMLWCHVAHSMDLLSLTLFLSLWIYLTESFMERGCVHYPLRTYMTES